MQPTRREILDYLRRQGKGSVKELGDLLALTSTGIRQHLTILERDGLIEGHEERGHIGRPALVYSLTKLGDALYPKRYASLATILLEETRATIGDKGVHELLQRAAARLAESYLVGMEGKGLPERVAAVARIMEKEGCLVSASSEGGTHYINRFTCPYPEVARAHNDLCHLDTEFVGRLLKTPVQLDACIVRGDRACTYRIKPR